MKGGACVDSAGQMQKEKERELKMLQKLTTSETLEEKLFLIITPRVFLKLLLFIQYLISFA